MSANAEARSSSIGSFLPLNSTVLPSDRDEASGFRWLTGNFRRSSVRRISLPHRTGGADNGNVWCVHGRRQNTRRARVAPVARS